MKRETSGLGAAKNRSIDVDNIQKDFDFMGADVPLQFKIAQENRRKDELEFIKQLDEDRKKRVFYCTMRWSGILNNLKRLAEEVGSKVYTYKYDEFTRIIEVTLNTRMFHLILDDYHGLVYYLRRVYPQDGFTRMLEEVAKKVVSEDEIDDLEQTARNWIVNGEYDIQNGLHVF